MLEVQVIGVEHRQIRQPLDVGNIEAPPLELDQALGAQFLEHPVDVDRSQARSLREVALRQMEIACAITRKANGAQTKVELEEQVRLSAMGGKRTLIAWR